MPRRPTDVKTIVSVVLRTITEGVESSAEYLIRINPNSGLARECDIRYNPDYSDQSGMMLSIWIIIKLSLNENYISRAVVPL